MKLAAPLLVAITIPLSAYTEIAQRPVSVTLKYRDGTTVTLAEDPSSLAELTLSSGQKTAKIPHEELKAIVAPELNKVTFIQTAEFETEKPLMLVSLKYDARPYEWGDDVSKVTFRFIEGEYHSRRTEIPIGKNSYKVLEKKVGEAEQEFGKSGVVEGVPKSK